MNDDSKPEDELWDIEGKEHPKIFHKGCEGQVVWVAKEEFRCLKCSEVVSEENWDVPDEPLLNKVRLNG
jgi:hypothetical protein